MPKLNPTSPLPQPPISPPPPPPPSVPHATSLPSLATLELAHHSKSILPLDFSDESIFIPLSDPTPASSSSSPSTIYRVPLMDHLAHASITPRHYQHGTILLDLHSSSSSCCVDFVLGTMRVQRLLVAARKKIWWMVPAWGEAVSDIPPETQFLLAEVVVNDEEADWMDQKRLRGGFPSPSPSPTSSSSSSSPRVVYVALLPLICNQGQFRATLRPPRRTPQIPLVGPPSLLSRSDALVCRLESGDTSVTASSFSSTLLLAAGTDPYDLLRTSLPLAASLAGGARPRWEKTRPDFMARLGWCTWDAFYSSVSATGVLEGLETLHASGVKPGFLIIDDGWQRVAPDPKYRTALGPLPTMGASTHALLSPAVTSTRPMEAEEFSNPVTDLIEDFEQRIELAIEEVTLLEKKMEERLARRAASLEKNFEQRMARATTAARQLERELEAKIEQSLASASSEMQMPHAWREKLEALIKATVELERKIESAMGATPIEGEEEEEREEREERGGRRGNKKKKRGVKASSRPTSPRRTAPRPTSQPSSRPTSPTSQEDEASKRRRRVTDASAPENAIPRTTPTTTTTTPPTTTTTTLVKSEKQPLSFVTRLLGYASGLIFKLYQNYIELAPPDSIPVRLFARMAQGVGRDAMLQWYASSNDFSKRLVSVEANDKFPSLTSLVATVKSKYGVKRVICWHAMGGYWCGVSPYDAGGVEMGAVLAEGRATAGVMEIEPSMDWNSGVLAGIGVVADPTRLHRPLHAYLAQCGVDGVKVDAQAGVALGGGQAGGGPFVTSLYHASMESSAMDHFHQQNNVINCMCHSTENIYRMHHSNVARASDDFWPRDPNSAGPHLAACAYNSVFLQALCIPDWDMFQSLHPEAERHAAARAISGGPIYISDKPGQHAPTVLKQLVLSDGTTLQPRRPALVTRDALFTNVQRDGKSALTLNSINATSGIVAAFNVQGQQWDRETRRFVGNALGEEAVVVAEIKPMDVHEVSLLEGMREHGGGGGKEGEGNAWLDASVAVEERVVRRMEAVATVHAALSLLATTRNASISSSPSSRSTSTMGVYAAYIRSTNEMRVVSSRQAIHVTLRRPDVEVVTFAPLLYIPTTDDMNDKSSIVAGVVAVIGLENMMNGGGAVDRVEVAPHGVVITVRGRGETLLLLSSLRPKAVSLLHAHDDHEQDKKRKQSRQKEENGVAVSFDYHAASSRLALRLPLSHGNDDEPFVVLIEYEEE